MRAKYRVTPRLLTKKVAWFSAQRAAEVCAAEIVLYTVSQVVSAGEALAERRHLLRVGHCVPGGGLLLVPALKQISVLI